MAAEWTIQGFSGWRENDGGSVTTTARWSALQATPVFLPDSQVGPEETLPPTFLSMPIMRDGKAIGVLQLDEARDRKRAASQELRAYEEVLQAAKRRRELIGPDGLTRDIVEAAIAGVLAFKYSRERKWLCELELRVIECRHRIKWWKRIIRILIRIAAVDVPISILLLEYRFFEYHGIGRPPRVVTPLRLALGY